MKVLICGGGIAGLTLAFCLHRAGHLPLVVEQAPHLRDGGYMIDFFGPGYDAAETLGLLPDLERIHYQIPRLSFVDDRGKEKFSIDYPSLRKLMNGRHFNFMRGDLEQVLYRRIENQVEVRFGASVDAFEQDEARVHVRLSDGTTESFYVLVGADGVHSRIRALAFGDEAKFSRLLGLYTAAFIVDDLGGYEGARGAFSTLTVPNRQVAVYPICGDRLATFFIHRASHPLHDFSRDAVDRELSTVYGSMGWIVPRLVEQERQAPSVYFDAVSQIVMPRWSAGHVVLLGDACQCVSLLAGQGASMAMAAAFVLSDELSAADVEVGAALVRYEQRLKPSIEAKQKSGRQMAGWFVPKDRLRLALRDLMTRLVTSPIASRLAKRWLASGSAIKGIGVS